MCTHTHTHRGVIFRQGFERILSYKSVKNQDIVVGMLFFLCVAGIVTFFYV